MADLIKTGTCLLPIFFFLAALVFLDSFKLLKIRSILLALFAGCIAGGLCYLLYNALFGLTSVDRITYTKYISPLYEETIKALYLWLLFARRRIGFIVDSAIYGFAIGAGFATIENVYVLQTLPDPNPLVWVIRGFGTAVMHGASTALVAIFTKMLLDRSGWKRIMPYLPGLLAAIVLHSIFNHFILPPDLITMVQLVLYPLILFMAFEYSERMLRDWLEQGLDQDVAMLESIRAGQFSETPAGRYLNSLRTRFPGEVVADMLCYLRIHKELAIRAKGILLMRESGFQVPLDPVLKEKFTELKFLENSIGKTGKLALAPILFKSTRELWQLYLVEGR